MNEREKCWCPGCGVVKTDYRPFPFCHHGAPASPHVARRMEPLPKWHPLFADRKASAR